MLFAGLAAAGAMNRGNTTLTAPSSSHLPLYVSLIAAEVGLIYLIRLGLSKGGSSLKDIAGPMSPSIPSWVRDILIAAVLWGAWIAIELVASRFVHSTPQISGLIPHGPTDGVIWIAVSVAAGVAEEITFRGYLLTQFHAMTGSVPVAVVLQALVFSIAHGYEGLAACASIGVFGLLFGVVALRAGNLRACIIAHAWTDIAAGLI